MEKFYTSELNVQILISLMKQHNISKVIASPGTTNVSFVASIQQDDFFEIYPSVDERSAAFMACGLAEECGEPVALSCTGATASRNYVPGMTAAFYNHLPILAITSSHSNCDIGHLSPQVTDRTQLLNDIAKYSFQLPIISSDGDKWPAVVGVNKALLELTHNRPGPVHINLATNYSRDFSVRNLPVFKKIDRIEKKTKLPELPSGNIAIIIGNHSPFSDKMTELIDRFCECHNAIVLCDQTSNYYGKYRILANIMTNQPSKFTCKQFDLVIHIGTVSGAYINFKTKEVWRIDCDGEVKDLYRRLKFVFQMDEETFFESYINGEKSNNMLLKKCKEEEAIIRSKIPEIPFSNIWIAKTVSKLLPKGSVLHLSILNTLRSWNFFEISNKINVFCNTGGFGIDGCMSSFIGASLTNPEKLYFGIFGDLAFFYDINVLLNHIVYNNVRIMLINNGIGTEFKNYDHVVSSFGKEGDKFMAAAGHFGNKSNCLVKNYAHDLGFEYLSASSKKEALIALREWTNPNIGERPVILEVFTDENNESNALQLMNSIVVDKKRKVINKLLGPKGIEFVKKLLRRN